MRSGFTLIELMIVVAILGILASIAVPTYREYVQESRRTDARNVLLNTAQRLERCYSTYGAYNDNNCALISSNSLDSNIPSDDGYYEITTSASTVDETSFTLEAEAQGSQTSDECGDFTLTHTGAKGVNDGSASVDDCWQ